MRLFASTTRMHGRRNRRRIGAGLALLAVVGVVVAIVSEISSSPSKRHPGGKDSTSNTTTVKRRDLVQTDTEPGTLGYAGPGTVYNRLNGTVTWLPSVGRVIKTGEALFKVDGKPVILMNGSTPAYRDLTASDSSGQDVLELNRNLVALGFNPHGIVVDDEWQAATTAGVEAFQASLGETETAQPLARADRVPARRSARLDSRCDPGLDRRQLRPGQSRLVHERERFGGRRHPRVRQPPQADGAQAPIQSQARRRQRRPRAGRQEQPQHTRGADRPAEGRDRRAEGGEGGARGWPLARRPPVVRAVAARGPRTVAARGPQTPVTPASGGNSVLEQRKPVRRQRRRVRHGDPPDDLDPADRDGRPRPEQAVRGEGRRAGDRRDARRRTRLTAGSARSARLRRARATRAMGTAPIAQAATTPTRATRVPPSRPRSRSHAGVPAGGSTRRP